MELKKILQNAVRYMEEHILDDIGYDDVAKSVFMSSYNFHRTFSTVAGMTANTYIRNRRLSLAGQELRTTDISVIDASLKYGYETPESFSKAFSKFHGISPIKARDDGAKLSMFNPLVIKIIIEGGNMMDYKIVRMDSQKFIAKVREYDNSSGNGLDKDGKKIPEFWDELFANGDIKKLSPRGKVDLYGLCSQQDKETTKFNYGIGAKFTDEMNKSEIDYLLEQGFTFWNLQPLTYVVFQCKGTDGACIGEAWERFFKEFLPNTNYEMAEGTDYELYPVDGEGGLFCELWIPIS